MPKGPGPPRKLNELEEARIVELAAVQMIPYRQVAQLWNNEQKDNPDKHISITLVANIVKRGLEKLAEENRQGTEAHRQRHSMIIDQALRVAWTIATGSRCSVCSGEKVVPKDRLDPDLGVQVCPKCDGSGRNEDDATRLAAIGQVKGLLERHAKVFGIDSPVEIASQSRVTVALDVSGLSDDALSLEAEGMFRQPVLEGVSRELEVGARSADTEPEPAALPPLSDL